MSTDYRPIDCGFHDRLEDFAVRGERCRIVTANGDGDGRVIESRIMDIFAADGEEFVELEHGERVRLDHLLEVTAIRG